MSYEIPLRKEVCKVCGLEDDLVSAPCICLVPEHPCDCECDECFADYNECDEVNVQEELVEVAPTVVRSQDAFIEDWSRKNRLN